MSGANRNPRLIFGIMRALLVTFLATLLSLAISLFVGILGVVVYSRIQHLSPNFQFVYRDIAPPFAITVGTVVLVLSLVMEIRHYRQAKILSRLEKAR